MRLAMGGMGILLTATSETDQTASAMVVDANGVLWLFQIMMIGIMVSFLCAGDFHEKDLNYELMGGHSRREIYFSRCILSVLITPVAALLLTFAPVVASTAVFGWGDTFRLSDAALRLVLFFFPFMRFAAFFSMAAFLTKNRGITMILSFASMILGIILVNEAAGKAGYALSIFNLMKLSEFGGFSLYNVVPGVGVVEYTAKVCTTEPELILGTILVSLAMAAVYLLAGYAFFRRDDLD
jgi:hypothetical protein